jgi:hypothetical protein
MLWAPYIRGPVGAARWYSWARSERVRDGVLAVYEWCEC